MIEGGGTFSGLKVRPDLEAATNDLFAQKGFFAYVICRTFDGQAWEVNVRRGHIMSALSDRYSERDAAVSAGAQWFATESKRVPDAVDRAIRREWELANNAVEHPTAADLVFLDSDAFVQALASDDGRAAKKHLAAGRAVYYEDPAYSSEGIIKLHPDGRRQIVTIGKGRVVIVVRDLE